MPKRDRLEDLGVLKVKLEDMGDNELFDLYTGRTKDLPDWFSGLSEEKQFDFLDRVAYGIDRLNSSLSECIMIAGGHHDDD